MNTPSKEILSAAKSYGSLSDSEKKAVEEYLLLQKWDSFVGDKSVEAGYAPLKNRQQKVNMAKLLQNQMDFQKTVKSPGERLIIQDTNSGDGALPTKFVAGLVRRALVPLLANDFAGVQPLPGPTGLIYFMDMLREDGAGNRSADSNILSLAPNAMAVAEGAVPPKARTQLSKLTVTATKQLLGVTVSSEALEDLRAVLGLDVEAELQSAWMEEFVRNRQQQWLSAINTAARTGAASVGVNLPAPQATAGAIQTLPVIGGSESIADYKSRVYNALTQANVTFARANKKNATKIICGLVLGAFLNKLITAVSNVVDVDSSSSVIGSTNYGTFMGRWEVVATEMLPDNQGFMYRPVDASPLDAGFIYAPYIPVTVSEPIYAGFQGLPGDGSFTNTDEWTRNIRERSASAVTKPYAFVAIEVPSGALSTL